MNLIKKERNLTNRKISEKANIPIATVDRLFSGANSNPSIGLLQKIAKLFKCEIDDFIEYEEWSQIQKTQIIKPLDVKNICENKSLLNLYSQIEKLDNEDITLLSDIVNRICKNN